MLFMSNCQGSTYLTRQFSFGRGEVSGDEAGREADAMSLFRLSAQAGTELGLIGSLLNAVPTRKQIAPSINYEYLDAPYSVGYDELHLSCFFSDIRLALNLVPTSLDLA